MREMEKSAAFFDFLNKKSPAQQINVAPVNQEDDYDHSSSVATLKKDLFQCEIRINMLRNELKRDPTKSAELQQAIMQHKRVLDQLSQIRERSGVV